MDGGGEAEVFKVAVDIRMKCFPVSRLWFITLRRRPQTLQNAYKGLLEISTISTSRMVRLMNVQSLYTVVYFFVSRPVRFSYRTRA